MKETTKMSRAVGQLEMMFRELNKDKFDGTLPSPIITVTATPNAYGHCSRRKIWRVKDGATYEINIAADTMARPIEKVKATLLHEMIHLYCRENDIQEVSRGGTYHNKRFAEIAERVGLEVGYDKKYGYHTHAGDDIGLLEYALSKGWTELLIQKPQGVDLAELIKRLGQIESGEETTGTESGEKTKKPSSTRKYQCPCCKNSVRATKEINIICGDCKMKMEVV